MTTFQDFNLPVQLVEALTRMNITTPTPIQAGAIPAGLNGKDILASAQTGTGKTMAYLLPILAKLLDSSLDCCLVLAPTRELAMQIKREAELLIGKNRHFGMALLIGGEPMFPQLSALRKGPRIVIGTPGRVIDHMTRGKLYLGDTRYLVLDETDRMLDIGFSEPIEQIIRELPKDRQTFMFSATMPQSIVKLSQKYLSTPERISIGDAMQASPQIKQEMLKLSNGEKFSRLLHELETREGSVIIFVKTKMSADNIAERLQRAEHRAEAIHGDLRQRKREQVIRSFRAQKSRILVATDVAARGLDIPHIMHVINFDLPQCPEDYIHRIGRTGRAGMEGFSLSFVSPDDARKWKVIHKMMNPDAGREYDFDSDSDRRPNRSRGNAQRRSFGGDFRSDRRPSDRFERRGDRPQFDRRSDDRGQARGEYRGDRPQFDRRSDDRAPAARGEYRGDRPQFDRRSDDRRPARSGDRPQFERRDDRAPAARGEYRGDRPQFDRRSDDRRPARSGDRPQFERRGDDRAPAARGEYRGDKPQFDRRSDDRRPARGGGGDRPQFERRGDDRRPARGGDRPQFERRNDDRAPAARGEYRGDKANNGARNDKQLSLGPKQNDRSRGNSSKRNAKPIRGKTFAGKKFSSEKREAV